MSHAMVDFSGIPNVGGMPNDIHPMCWPRRMCRYQDSHFEGVHDLGLLTVCGLVFSSRIRLNQVLPGNQRASQGGYFVILNFINMSIINSKFCRVSLHQKVAPPWPDSHWQSLRLLRLFSHIEQRMRCGNPCCGNPCDFWRKFRSQTSIPTLWTDGKQRWEESQKRKE